MELAAMHWLRYQKGCALITLERQPRHVAWSRPDALGLTVQRELVEVEIKRTVADFKANAKKRHVILRNSFIDRWPHWFYFLVPKALAPALADLRPTWAGLLTFDSRNGQVVAEAPARRNIAAPRLSLHECVRMAQLQTQTLMGVATAAAYFRAASLRLNSGE